MNTKKNWQMSKVQSEAINQTTDNTMSKSKSHFTRRFQESAEHTHRVPDGSPDLVNIQQSRF